VNNRYYKPCDCVDNGSGNNNNNQNDSDKLYSPQMVVTIYIILMLWCCHHGRPLKEFIRFIR